MSRSSTWLSAEAPPHASASPPSVASTSPSGGTPARPDEQTAERGQEQQHHDAGLRQRHVVAPRNRSDGQRMSAAEGQGAGHRGCRERERAEGDVQSAEPACVGQGDEPAEPDLDQEDAERRAGRGDEHRSVAVADPARRRRRRSSARRFRARQPRASGAHSPVATTVAVPATAASAVRRSQGPGAG